MPKRKRDRSVSTGGDHSHTHASPDRYSILTARRTILIVCVAILFVTIVIASERCWAMVVYRLLTDGLLAASWLAASIGIGGALASLWLGKNIEIKSSARIALDAALGIGAIGLLVLGLGLTGLLRSFSAWSIIAIGLFLLGARLSPQWPALDRSSLQTWLRESIPWAWVWALVMPALGIAIVAALIPPGVLWGDEPNGYDVAEYHLQVPREWYEAGRIVPLPHNVFASMPMGVEMHYLLAMHLRGGPWAGMYLAQIMHVAMIGLSMVVLLGLVKEAAGNANAAAALLAMSAAPWLLLLAPVAYNEGGLLLFGAAAIGLVWRGLRDRQHDSIRRWALAGAMAGFACGVKLTAVPMLLVGIPISVCVAWAISRQAGQFKSMLLRCGVFVAVGLIVLSPWLVRNIVWLGNPVFPEATEFLGVGRFSEVQIERWHRAHSATAAQQSLEAKLYAAGEQIVWDWRYGYVLLPMALIGIAMHRRRESWFLCVLLVMCFVVWIGFTHLQSRFFVLAIPVTALVIASLNGYTRAVATGVLALSTLFGLANWHARYYARGEQGIPRLTKVIEASALGQENLDGLHSVDLSNVPPDRKVVLVGDAQAFFYSRPMSQLRYRTVFDAGSEPDSWLTAWTGGDLLKDAVIVVDPNELRRFTNPQTGYWKIPPAPADIVERSAPFVLP